MTDCVTYRRVSSERQEEEGFSLAAQEHRLQEHAEKKSLNIVRDFCEAETAKASGRAEFDRMLHFLKQPGAPKIILVEKPDRLTRNFHDMVAIEDLMQQHGVEIHLVRSGRILRADMDTMDETSWGLEVLIAKSYIGNLRKETRKGIAQKVREGGWAWLAPFGYRNNRLTKQIEIDPEEAPFVIQAFQLYATGAYSLEAVAEKLHRDGFTYKPYMPKIHKSKLHAMLQHRVYMGEIEFQGEVYAGKHSPLVDRQTWFAVQRAFRKDNKPTVLHKLDFIYRGLLACGECGRAVVGERKHRGGRSYVYYRCCAMKKGCSQGYFSERDLDEQVSAFFGRLVPPADWQERVRQMAEELDVLHRNTRAEEEARLETQRKKYKDQMHKAYMDRLAGLIDADMYQEVRDTIESKLADIESQRQSIDRADFSYHDTGARLVELPERIGRGWFSAGDEQRKGLLNLVTSNIFVRDGNAVIELKEALKVIQFLGEEKKKLPTRDELREFLVLHSATIVQLHRKLAG